MTQFVNGEGFAELREDLELFYQFMNEGELDNLALTERQEIISYCRSIIEFAKADGIEQWLWCPKCGEKGDMTSIQDHGRCIQCLTDWQFGILTPEQTEEPMSFLDHWASLADLFPEYLQDEVEYSDER